MIEIAPKKTVYLFGNFALNVDTRQLSFNGEPVDLAPKVYDTLLILVENRGHVLNKEELQRKIWPDSFVSEINLTVNISALRKVLGEEPDNPKYIKTVPRHGYRFIGHVEVADESVTSDSARHLSVVDPAGEKKIERAGDRVSLVDSVRAIRLKASPRSLSVALALLLALVLPPAAFHITRLLRSAAPQAHTLTGKTIAILPIRNFSSKPDLYFELSLADALITRLAGLGKIRVLPTTSRAAGRDDDPIAAGRKLGADLVISGLIRKIDGNVRVCIHLISVNDGTVLWATQFNALADDMFILQETICMQVVQGLGPLLGEKSLSALRRNSADPEAYEAYLRGSYYWNNPAPESLAKSIECFEYATKRDAGYALAYAMLADSQALLSQQLTDEAARAETAARSWENALKALELNPNLAEAHIALGLTVADSNRQEAAYRRALQLDPNNAVAYHRYATMLYGQGRIDESLESFKRAHNLDQLSYATWTSLAPLFNHKGKPESRTGLSPTVTGRHPGGLKAPACFAVARRLQKCNDRAMAGIDPVLADPGNTPSP